MQAQLSKKQKFEFKKLIKELKSYRGRRTELVSVLIPAGYELSKIINMLVEEKSTASNIKSAQTRKNVTTALEKIIQHLQLFKQTPPTGLAVFCGNVGEEGKPKFVLRSIIPPEPLQTRIYRCDQVFYVQPLEEMLKPKDVYGLVVIEKKEATVGLLKGKRIEVLKHFRSLVPGKFRAGGQSAQRFERQREALAHDFYKKLMEVIKENLMNTKGILLGGPGPTKEEFYAILPHEIKKKIIAIKDVGYSDEYGLRELVEKSQDVLAKTELAHEVNLLQEFFRRIAKGLPVAYGEKEVEEALWRGAVEKLLISEGLPGEKVEEWMEKAEQANAEVELISTDTDEGKQFLAMGGVGALLRY